MATIEIVYNKQVNFGDVPDIPETGDWIDAIATRDIDGAITDWYVANTGHDASLSYLTLPAGTWLVTNTWLTTNNGNGRVSFDGSRWLVERYRSTGAISVSVNNVTFRNCHVDSTGALYAARSTVNASGIRFEYCTFQGNQANPNGATINFPSATEVDQIYFDHVDLSGWRAGIYCFAGITAQYCWSHDLYFTAGSHNTGASIRGGNVHLYRNLITDGNSSALSHYPEVGPYDNVYSHENIFRLQDADFGPEVIVAGDREFTIPLPGETRRCNDNLFYRGGNLASLTGGPVGGGFGGEELGLTEFTGNYDREGNPVTL